ncbi:MAG: phosphoribosylglycinamide formyltransferase [Candidatus Marinimicrobia bacterium]|nr:phosphoribosylglycinamide formyltransferase [Candidatus Neomarinimicrobiota bacterium]|tara:strand:- start:3247 stop:3837 length:591 start_codon:yes stop_codon:yes gene_type:complete
MIRLGVLGSTNGTDLQAILDAIELKQLKSKLATVISNNKKAFILKRAEKYRIPSYYISHKNIDRETFDRKVTEILIEHKVDLVLLIGFMRILSKSFCQEWRGKILNVHPSLLPKYAGGMDTNVHEEVLKNKDDETGCTIHFVTDEVDGGPIFIQKKCSVDPKDTIKSLKTKVQKLEGEAFLEAIPLFENKYILKNE